MNNNDNNNDSSSSSRSSSSSSSSTPKVHSLSFAGLESVYDALAAAIDRAGPDKSELLLVKLALLNAQALGDAALFQAHLDQALMDL